jgi:hypothetical protein
MQYKFKYKNLNIGELYKIDQLWYFKYTEDFINQDKILPLIIFPNKYKEYVSSELWHIFAIRFKDGKMKLKTITDPYMLISCCKNYF